MFRRIMLKIKERTGISATTELVILIVVIAGIAISLGNGLNGVFVGDGGVVDKLKGFVTQGFDGVIPNLPGGQGQGQQG